MPLYEYRCDACSRIFEAYKRLSEESGKETCPSCGGTAGRLGISLFSAPAGGTGSKAGSSTCGGKGRSRPFS